MSKLVGYLVGVAFVGFAISWVIGGSSLLKSLVIPLLLTVGIFLMIVNVDYWKHKS